MMVLYKDFYWSMSTTTNRFHSMHANRSIRLNPLFGFLVSTWFSPNSILCLYGVIDSTVKPMFSIRVGFVVMEILVEIEEEASSIVSLYFLFKAWFWFCKFLMALATCLGDAVLSMSSHSSFYHSWSWVSSHCVKVSDVCWSSDWHWYLCNA